MKRTEKKQNVRGRTSRMFVSIDLTIQEQEQFFPKNIVLHQQHSLTYFSKTAHLLVGARQK